MQRCDAGGDGCVIRHLSPTTRFGLMQDKGCGSLFGWKRKLEALTVKPSGASRAAFPCLIKFLNCSKTGMVGVWLAEGEDEEERSGLAESIVGIGSTVLVTGAAGEWAKSRVDAR